MSARLIPALRQQRPGCWTDGMSRYGESGSSSFAEDSHKYLHVEMIEDEENVEDRRAGSRGGRKN